jgi:hypothetical protein
MINTEDPPRFPFKAKRYQNPSSRPRYQKDTLTNITSTQLDNVIMIYVAVYYNGFTAI